MNTLTRLHINLFTEQAELTGYVSLGREQMRELARLALCQMETEECQPDLPIRQMETQRRLPVDGLTQ